MLSRVIVVYGDNLVKYDESCKHDESCNDEQVEEQRRKREQDDSSLSAFLYISQRSQRVQVSIDERKKEKTCNQVTERTFKQIPCIGPYLHPHNTRRMRFQPRPCFIEHTEPLGILGDRFGIRGG